MAETKTAGAGALNLTVATEHLFSRDYLGKEFYLNPNQTDAEAEEMEREADRYLDVVDELLEQYSWCEVYASWVNYLKTKCPTPRLVLNWEHLFNLYADMGSTVKDPHDLLGYLLYRTLPSDGYMDSDAAHMLWSLSLSLLSAAGELPGYWDEYEFSKDVKTVNVMRKYRKDCGEAPGLGTGEALLPGDSTVKITLPEE